MINVCMIVYILLKYNHDNYDMGKTDSDWFRDLVEEKVKKLLVGEEEKRGINSD